MPIKTYFFYHFIAFSFFISSNNYIEENDNIKDYTRKNMETVKTCNEEKEISKEAAETSIKDSADK